MYNTCPCGCSLHFLSWDIRFANDWKSPRVRPWQQKRFNFYLKITSIVSCLLIGWMVVIKSQSMCFFLVLYRVFALEIDWAVFENLKILLGDIWYLFHVGRENDDGCGNHRVNWAAVDSSIELLRCLRPLHLVRTQSWQQVFGPIHLTRYHFNIALHLADALSVGTVSILYFHIDLEIRMNQLRSTIGMLRGAVESIFIERILDCTRFLHPLYVRAASSSQGIALP